MGAMPVRYDRVVDLDLELLRTFAAVADAGSFTRAAEHLGLTQPTVSQQIQRLETRTGVELVDRRRKAIRLTGSGEVLLSYARHMLRRNEEAVARLRSARVEGEVSLGVTEHVASGLPALLESFTSAHPAVQLQVELGRSSVLLKRLDEGCLDLTVALAHDSSRAYEPLFREPVAWVAAPGFDCARPELPLVTFNEGCPLRRGALEALDKVERKWRVAFTTTSPGGVQAAVSAGLGLGILLSGEVGPELEVRGSEDGLPPLFEAEVGLFRSPRALRPAVRQLDRFLIERFRDGRAPAAPAAG